MSLCDEGIRAEDDFSGVTKACISMESMRHLYEMRSNNVLCDAIIKLDDASTFNVHRNILSACSSYFRALFTTTLTGKKKGDDVCIPGIRSSIMEEIISYAYLRSCKIDSGNVHELYAVGDYCGILGLMRHCVNFMIRTLTPENCVSLMNFGK